VSGQLYSPAALTPGKEPPVLMDRRLGWFQSLSGHCREERDSQPLPGIEP